MTDTALKTAMGGLGNDDGDGPAGAAILRVTDVKQWIYCPRICYWTYVAPVEKRMPFKVERGAEDHAVLARLEGRRGLSAYGLKEGKRRFHARVESRSLGLTGVLDLLLETEEERIPVEYKDTLGGARLNHRIQLAAYAMALEETEGPPARRGMVYVIPENRVVVVRLDGGLRNRVREALAAIRRTIATEEMPPPADRWGKCRDCEYFRFCGDRYEGVSQEG